MTSQQLILVAAAGILVGLWWTRQQGGRPNLGALGLQQRVNASGLPVGFGAAPGSYWGTHGIFSQPGPVNTWSLI